MSKLIGHNWTGVKQFLDTFWTLFGQVSNFELGRFLAYTEGMIGYGVYAGLFTKKMMIFGQFMVKVSILGIFWLVNGFVELKCVNFFKHFFPVFELPQHARVDFHYRKSRQNSVFGQFFEFF